MIDPERQWNRMERVDTLDAICESYNIDSRSMDLYKIKSRNIPENEYIIIDENHRLSPYVILNQNVWNIVVDGEQPFRDDVKRSNILRDLTQWVSHYIEQDGIPGISTGGMYRTIIQQKIIIDCESTDNAPNTFEALLRRSNPVMSSLLDIIRNDHDSIITLARAIINALETYTNSSLSALEFSVLGGNEYIRILKEVISYFKSYMVEYTKDELSLVFDGLYDRGGNSNMIQLYDDIAHIQFRLIVKDSLSLYDVSHANVFVPQPDDNTDFMYDDAIFRVRTTYQQLLNIGYDIWYDTGTELTKEPFEIGMNDKVIANMIPNGTAYKIIIPIENVGESKIPPNYVGNVY